MKKVGKGDRIRILEDGLLGANVLAGDELEVTGRISPNIFVVESPRRPQADGWWLTDSREGEGWERV